MMSCHLQFGLLVTTEDIFDVMSRFRMMANTIWDKVGLEYDIFALHTIWNKAEVERTLGPGAVFITILRDPVQLFESLWVYAGLGKYYGTDLESFALAKKEGKFSMRAYRSVGVNVKRV